MIQKIDPQANPWTVLSSKISHENPWFKVREHEVIRPDGNPGGYYVVETRYATGVVALTPQQEIYLVGQYRFPTKEYSWEIVEGGSDPQESPLHAAQRELKEEAGLIAKRWTPLGGELHLSNCISSERGYLFLAEDLVETETSPDPTEVLQLRKLPLKDCLALVESGEIKDTLSVIAILRLARALKL